MFVARAPTDDGVCREETPSSKPEEVVGGVRVRYTTRGGVVYCTRRADWC
jgi:hypothetical protein